MPSFSPEAIYERGRQQVAASQPRFYEQFRQLLADGLALCIEKPGESPRWLACAPWSRLEPGLLLVSDLAAEDQAVHYRIAFEQLDFTEDTWGWFLVAGHPVVSFRPIAESDTQEYVELWNARSGRPPVQLRDF